MNRHENVGGWETSLTAGSAFACYIKFKAMQETTLIQCGSCMFIL